MYKYPFLIIGFCCLSLISLNTGCQQSTEPGQQTGHGHDHDHDHSERPETLRAAIQELRKVRDAISTAIEKNDTESAHEPLHEVGSLLQSLPDLAADTDLSESDWDIIKAEADRLFDAFGKIDAAFHHKDGDKQAAYDASKSTVDEAVGALEAFLPKLGDARSQPKHDDHEHDDHRDENHEESSK